MADSCPEEVVKSVFCTQRKDPCPCPKKNKYKDCVGGEGGALDTLKDTKMPDLPDSEHGAGKYLARRGSGVQYRAVEAHHIVSCAGVKDEIQAFADIKEIVKATSYCVNHSGNMIALPRFAHTLSWYGNLPTGTLRKTELQPPPFAGLAQHCTDHAPYLTKIRDACKEVAGDVVVAAKKHAKNKNKPAPNLAGNIDGLVATFRPWLEGKNTHESWLDGMKNPNGDWYVAFSMVPKADAVKMCFPVPGGTDRVSEVLNKLANYFKRLG